MSDELDDLVARLCGPILTEETMRAWDKVRLLIAQGNTGSHPRDVFELTLDGWDEERREAADAIRSLWAALDACQEERDALETAREMLGGFWAKAEAALAAAQARVAELEAEEAALKADRDSFMDAANEYMRAAEKAEAERAAAQSVKGAAKVLLETREAAFSKQRHERTEAEKTLIFEMDWKPLRTLSGDQP